MLNDHTLARFPGLGKGLLKPMYDYSFGNLAPTLHYLLTGEETGPLIPADCFGGSYPRPRKVVLFFIDSFGWQFWQRYWERSRIMRNVVEGGILTPISALFPSTTAASVTTLNLGCLPARHAVYEWNVYVPAYGETIQSLAFQTVAERPEPCVSRGFDVRQLMTEHDTMHQRLAAHGVQSIQLAHRNYAGSPYNMVASAGAKVVPHATLPELLVHLRETLETTPGKALINAYWAALDTAAHAHGPGTRIHDAEVIAFWRTMDALLEGLKSPDTLYLFTADHGQVHLPKEQTVYVNERWPELREWLQVSPTGRTIWPNGSPRDMFLHIKAEYREKACRLLAEGLGDMAEVMPVADAIAGGLFGPAPISNETRHRLGDVLVLPRREYAIWWREPGVMANPFNGNHGGLTPEELISVLGVCHEL